MQRTLLVVGALAGLAMAGFLGWSDHSCNLSTSVEQDRLRNAPFGAHSAWGNPQFAIRNPQSFGDASFGASSAWAMMNPEQRAIIQRIQAVPRDQRQTVVFCMAPDTPQEVVELFHQAMWPETGLRYEQANRWPGAQGTPISLTYSFVPDGVAVPANAGINGGTNSINAMLTNIFGTLSAGKMKVRQFFDRWTAATGITYTEVSDDGAPLFGSAGSPTRGDLRLSAISMDGSGGVLAYNNLPTAELGNVGGGDMVLDAADVSLFSNSANDYRFLRNTMTHEHGHGQGLLHVCPTNQTKLMEPSISTAFDGPQHDDIRSSQRHYGDPSEINDSPATATDLGGVSGTMTLTNRSIDDNSDLDFYAVSVPAGRRISATVTPMGSSYSSGPQTFFGCLFSPTTTINSLTIHNLNLALMGTDGASVLASASGNPAGSAESISNYDLPGAGTFYVRVTTGSTTDDIQMYTLGVTVVEAPGTCFDGIQNQGEQDIDCGGPCPPCATGDFDDDGDIDLVDARYFQNCFGPSVKPGCAQGDLDGDNDIDLDDFRDFTRSFTGP